MDLGERCRKLQVDYWTFDAGEKERLLARRRGEEPAWKESLRLLHLLCLEPSEDAVRAELAAGMEAAAHPCRPRHAALWQGEPGAAERRKPDAQGRVANASLTHRGCLEVIRLADPETPLEVDFVPFDDLQGVAFATPTLFRYAKLFYDTPAEPEIVIVPLLYGTSWRTGEASDRDGSLTRFVNHVGNRGVGVGQQDLEIATAEGKTVMMGLGSVGEAMFALDAADPKFDAKCRVRGLDPDQVRREIS